MKINMLGTGHGMALNCFNTCFTLENNGRYFLVDSGGGQTILKQLFLSNIKLENIDSIFISHKHIDHILGCIWIIRSLLPKYFKGELFKKICIYGNDEVICAIEKMCDMLMPIDFNYIIKDKIKLIELKDGDVIKIIGQKIKFFDINAKKVKQFGFTMNLNDKDRFTFIGDETCSLSTEKYVKNSKWLFADAYMAGEEAKKYNPIEKHHHSTVEFISKLSKKLDVQNLILSHTIDNDLNNRKEKFKKDSKKYFDGNVFIPDDLEEIDL